MQQTVRKWTLEEVTKFSEWDQKRKTGQLGSPMRFNTVEELKQWLHATK